MQYIHLLQTKAQISVAYPRIPIKFFQNKISKKITVHNLGAKMRGKGSQTHTSPGKVRQNYWRDHLIFSKLWQHLFVLQTTIVHHHIVHSTKNYPTLKCNKFH